MKLKPIFVVLSVAIFCQLSCQNEEIEPEYSISLDVKSLNFESVPEEKQGVVVTCNGQWTLSTDEDDSWCEASEYKGYGDAEIFFTVEPNMETVGRSILYEFMCEGKKAELRVSQSAHSYFISLEYATIAFDADGEEKQSVTVTSSDNWTLEIEDKWCEASVTSGYNDDKVTFSVKDNTGNGEDRSTIVIFTCGDKTAELEVIQKGKLSSIFVEPKELVFDAEDESGKEVVVTSSTDWALEVKDGWCVPSVEAGGNGDKVKFTVEKNSEIEDRSTEVIFTDENGKTILQILQYAKEYSIDLDKTKEEVDFRPNEVSVKVASSDSWTLDVIDDWCTPSAVEGENGDIVNFAISANYSQEIRSTVAVFRCGDKTVEFQIIQGISETEFIQIESEAFLKALIDTGVDTDGDGCISIDEANAVKELDLTIQSQEIETYRFDYFPMLESLSVTTNRINSILDVSGHMSLNTINVKNAGSVIAKDCPSLEYVTCRQVYSKVDVGGCSSLIELDCMQCQRLEDINVRGCSSLTKINCYGNNIITLDVSDCTALSVLYCDDNQLSSLDVSNCPALKTLRCEDNQLSSIDVSACHELSVLDCSDNQLSDIRVSGLSLLENLDCSDNKYLTALDLSGCETLETLNCYGNLLSHLDISGCTKLSYMNCRANQLTMLDVSRNSALVELRCDGNLLTSFDISGNTSITELHLPDNPLSSLNVAGCSSLINLSFSSDELSELDVCGCIALTELRCSSDKLSHLDVSGLTALKELYCGGEQLMDLNMSGCTSLSILSCQHSKLTELDVKGHSSLTQLLCTSNELTYLDVSGCTALTKLYCGDNQLSDLDLSECTALTNLTCENNKLTELNVSDCMSLTDIRCNDNMISYLDVSGHDLLELLYCQNNQLTKIELSGCTSLTYLDFDGNDQLSDVDAHGCSALWVLDCRENQLVSLNVSGCAALKYLYCEDNQLTDLNVTGCTALESLDCDNNRLTILDVSSCVALDNLGCDNNLLTKIDASGCDVLSTLYCSGNNLSGLYLSRIHNIPSSRIKNIIEEYGDIITLVD